MQRSFAFFSLLVVLILFSRSSLEAQEVTTLQLGTSIERTIASGQTHVFTINLEAGQFVELVVWQKGIDVVVHIVGPDQKNLGDFDSPNGDDGPENVSFAAAVAGLYAIGVNPLNQGDDIKPGRYEIKLLEVRQATDQELASVSGREELKANALALVRDTALGIPEVRSRSIRIHAQLQAAGLLWTADEKAASKLMTDAVAGIKEYIASIDLTDPDSAQDLQAATMLRYELIQALAPHDPEMALSFLRSTRIVPESESEVKSGRLEREDQIELALADQISNRDPKRTFQIAEDNLKNGLSTNLYQTVMRLRNSDPELARKLAKDIAARVLEEKLLNNREALELAVNLARDGRAPIRRRQGVTREGGGAPLLSDQDLRDLMQKILRDALAISPANSDANWSGRDAATMALSALKELGPELERFVPGSTGAVEKRLSEIVTESDPRRAMWDKYQSTVNTGPIETAAESIKRAPVELREQLFQQLAERMAASGDVPHARQILNEKISNPWQRRQALNNLEQQFIFQCLAKGKVEEALRSLATLRPPKARSMIISQIANQIGPGRKQAVALNLLEQARSMLGESPLAEDQEEMNALLELAAAFSRYDVKRAFEIVEPLLDQFNEISEAARKLSGFGQESHRDGELILNNGNTIANLSTQIIKVLSTLGMLNIERTKAAVARIQAPEIRLIANLGVAQQILQPQR